MAVGISIPGSRVSIEAPGGSGSVPSTGIAEARTGARAEAGDDPTGHSARLRPPNSSAASNERKPYLRFVLIVGPFLGVRGQRSGVRVCTRARTLTPDPC